MIGHENLIKPNVAAEIAKARAKRSERAELTADWVVDELRKLAGSNMADYMKSTPEGRIVLDFSGLTRDQMAALSQVKVSAARLSCRTALTWPAPFFSRSSKNTKEPASAARN